MTESSINASSGSSAVTTAAYTYDGYNNRVQLTTAAGVTHYDYANPNDPNQHTELISKTDPDGKVTTYTYDLSGNLTQAVYDQTGANQITSYTYDANRLTGVTKPDGTQIAFSYDPNGQRTSVSVTPPGGTASVVKDYYQLGHLAYQTDGNGTLLASFTYDSNGAPVSVQVGSDPSSAPRYYDVYNAHGDVVSLVDASGASVASYSYDSWGHLTSSSERFTNATGWTNPYRYDGRDGARYDASDGLYWLAVRAYDPTLGRFLSRDPLNRAPMVFVDQPYAYAGNNPVSNVDPSGQQFFFRHAIPVSPRPDGANNEVWHWHDGNKKRRDRYSAWMGPLEQDTRGWHFNLHLSRGGIDFANYHVYYVGMSCVEDQDSYMWWIYDTSGRRRGENMFFSGPGNLGRDGAAEIAASAAAGWMVNSWGLPKTFFNRIMDLPTSLLDPEWVVDAVTQRHLPDMLKDLSTKTPITDTTPH